MENVMNGNGKKGKQNQNQSQKKKKTQKPTECYGQPTNIGTNS